MLNEKKLSNLNWTKTNGMLPAIVQDSCSYEVLMHGYMNKEALLQTQENGLVTFYSRTKNRLWVKGEKSGNYLKVLKVLTDCDYDTLLVIVKSIGKTCHLGNKSCFFSDEYNVNFLNKLENIIENKKKLDVSNSYTTHLYKSGTSRIAQKVGEEAIETILAAMKKNKNELIDETSDLIYHLIVLLHDQNLTFNTVLNNLRKRNEKK